VGRSQRLPERPKGEWRNGFAHVENRTNEVLRFFLGLALVIVIDALLIAVKCAPSVLAPSNASFFSTSWNSFSKDRVRFHLLSCVHRVNVFCARGCSLTWSTPQVGDRLGWNEKTKVVAKLQRSGAGPPAREPAVSEEERKAMMAHYFKRQVKEGFMVDN